MHVTFMFVIDFYSSMHTHSADYAVARCLSVCLPHSGILSKTVEHNAPVVHCLLQGGWMAADHVVMPTIQSWISYHVRTLQPICKKTGTVLICGVDKPGWYARLEDVKQQIPVSTVSCFQRTT